MHWFARRCLEQQNFIENANLVVHKMLSKGHKKGVHGHTLWGLRNNMAVRCTTKNTPEFGSDGFLGNESELQHGDVVPDNRTQRLEDSCISLKEAECHLWENLSMFNSSTTTIHTRRFYGRYTSRLSPSNVTRAHRGRTTDLSQGVLQIRLEQTRLQCHLRVWQ